MSLGHMQGIDLLMAKHLYGSGLRLMECVCLRIRDLDFEYKLIYVRAAKGDKYLFPESLHPIMKSQVKAVEKLHQKNLAHGYGEVYLPGAIVRKYPNAAKSFGWQYVFLSKIRSTDPRSGKTRRHHVLESGARSARFEGFLHWPLLAGG
ncbi:MAG: tyrosine-type recombinase/integrase [Deltaproteobacteria bacterium]|jgi:integrase|nr:tyrosine-type recombinase/integrase [Deltaproteobacteria bacterium]